MKESPKIFVVIPAYCAEKSIKQVIDTIPSLVDTIIVIDDCSKDQTSQVVNSIADNRVVLIRHEQNQGVGGAMMTGYQAAAERGADIIVKMDSDGQMDPRHLEALIEPIIQKEADYVKGNRFLHSVQLKKMPFIRRVGNIALSFMTKFASGYWKIFDPTNGYTALSARLISIINFQNIARDYFFEISLLCELGILQAVVKDIHIPAVYNSEKSYLSEWKSSYGFLVNLIRKSIRRITIQYFIRDFSAVTLFLCTGFLSILFSLIWGIFFWVRSAQTGTPATTGTVMIAVLPLILGFQFILQAIVMDVNNTPIEIITNKSL